MVVLLNKNDQYGLLKALESLTVQEDLKICEDFHVLVMDGGSKDMSKDVVYSFSKLYPCITFKVQKFSGGVGPARIEAVRYALDNKYDFIVWGDSGNEYSPMYLRNLLAQAKNNECEVISGFTVVKDNSLWSKLLFWYHIYHQLFGLVRKRHAPGNNKLVKSSVYDKVMYLPTSRSDDFFFSLLASEKDIKFCHSSNAVIKVSMPSRFRDVIGWENARVKGLIEGYYILGKGFPPILPLWFAYSFAPAIILGLIYILLVGSSSYLLGLLGTLTLIYLSGMGLVSVKLSPLVKKAYERPYLLQEIVALVGMYVHSVLTTYYMIKYLLKLRKRSHELRNKAREILRAFGFSESF